MCRVHAMFRDEWSLQELIRVYDEEKYILTWHGGRGHVAMQHDATASDVLRSVWQVSATLLVI